MWTQRNEMSLGLFLSLLLVAGCNDSQSYVETTEDHRIDAGAARVGRAQLSSVLIEESGQDETCTYWAFGDNFDMFKPAICAPHPGAPMQWCLYVRTNKNSAEVVKVEGVMKTYFVTWYAGQVETARGKGFLRGRGQAVMSRYEKRAGGLVPSDNESIRISPSPVQLEFELDLRRARRMSAAQVRGAIGELTNVVFHELRQRK